MHMENVTTRQLFRRCHFIPAHNAEIITLDLFSSGVRKLVQFTRDNSEFAELFPAFSKSMECEQNIAQQVERQRVESAYGYEKD